MAIVILNMNGWLKRIEVPKHILNRGTLLHTLPTPSDPLCSPPNGIPVEIPPVGRFFNNGKRSDSLPVFEYEAR